MRDILDVYGEFARPGRLGSLLAEMGRKASLTD
jgi:hypothetical protein